MRPRGTISLRLGLAAVVAYFIAHFLGWHTLALLMKPMPVLCLLAFLLPVHNRDAGLIAAGLVLSALGDVLLEASPALFLPGLVAFLLAHVAYVIAYLGRTSRFQLMRLVPVALFSGAAFHLLEPHLGAMRGPVIAYMVVISIMLWRAMAQIGADGTGGLRPWLATIGAWMFAISDLMVAWSRFVDPEASMQVPLLLLYWAGQTAIASSTRRD
jgi:alkenylglycerophosphocholine/alkenylglycerophosphoethanolamine hydrolase